MSKTEQTEQAKYRVIRYLYGAMSATERAQFDTELQTDPRLQTALAQEQHFNRLVPAGLRPHIDTDRLQGNWFMLQQRLHQTARSGFFSKGWINTIRRRPWLILKQGAIIATSFLLGILVSTGNGFNMAPFISKPSDTPINSPLALIGETDYEIFQLQVENYDATTGDIALRFALASESRISGNIADQEIHSLMAVALKNNINSAARLDAIEALQPLVTDRTVYEALIHVLDNDSNPGVRFQAVQALTQLLGEEPVRAALRRALQRDTNEGVRVQAFQALAQALTQYREPETLAVFRQQIDQDSNPFIRSQAQQILTGMDDGSIAL
ncbi:MAG: HEAT repeat domain-containing protein [Pseudomonadales bacterium]|nr:HEAT repeat domain-containing protein [Pseudomonadales bacterium]